jgi:hypothetical protein
VVPRLINDADSVTNTESVKWYRIMEICECGRIWKETATGYVLRRNSRERNEDTTRNLRRAGWSLGWWPTRYLLITSELHYRYSNLPCYTLYMLLADIRNDMKRCYVSMFWFMEHEITN